LPLPAGICANSHGVLVPAGHYRIVVDASAGGRSAYQFSHDITVRP